MADSTQVDVFNACNELLVQSNSCLLMKSLMTNDVIEEFSILAVFHDKKQLTFSFDDLIQLYHVWVSDFLENLDLSTDSLDVLLVLNP